MAALFAIFFPLGAIILRLSKSRNAAWIHGIWQAVSLIGALAGFGIGVYLATVEDKVSLTQENSRVGPCEANVHKWVTQQGHAIIGTIVIAFLVLQPLGGFLHHQKYRSHGKPTLMGSVHRWTGRVFLVLGVINGGLGLWLADEDKNFIIP